MAKRKGRITYIVVFHFDGNTGFNYQDTPARRAKTVDRPAWWEHRAAIMKRYVIPALKAQTFQQFEVWGLFMRGYEQLARPVLGLFRDNGYNVTFNGPAALREIYKTKTDWLACIHNDSDDLYSRGAFALFARQHPMEGRVVYCPCGYAYDVNDKSKPLARIGRKGMPPPSFYVAYYPGSALQSEPHWYGYRRRYGFEVRHFRMNRVKNPVGLYERCYCILLHGKNTMSQWQTLKGRTVGAVPASERAQILAKFGVIE